MSFAQKISGLVDETIKNHIFPGCAIGVVRHKERWSSAFGHHTYEAHSPAVTTETVYDCASVTKSIPLATLALQCIAEQKLSVSDKLIDYVPEYIGGYRNEITIKHFFT